ncbi:MAG: EAL domain-containing protein [Magnetovibrio sp.]|nr:EAL domain-containing protein [Magnetovibrio sp.]
MADYSGQSQTVLNTETPALRQVWRNFYILFIPIVLVVLIAAAALFTLHITHTRTEITDRELSKINFAQMSVRETLNSAISDAKFLSKNEVLFSYIRNPIEANRQSLERTLLAFSDAKNVFDQVRFIDASGQEQVRVNLVDRTPVAAARDELQGKRHRYYFRDAIDIKPGQVFLSRLDLNIEQKKIELPYKPMLRLVAPVDVEGERKGVVVLNYLAENFLGHVRRGFLSDVSEGYLVNADGYWLIGPSRDQEWAFMFNRFDRVQDIYPTLWQLVSDQVVQEATSQGVFTALKLTPPKNTVITSNSDLYWVLISRVPLSVWYRDQIQEYIPVIVILVLTLGLMGVVSWRVSMQRVQRRMTDMAYKRKLENALSESEHRSTAVVEASDDVVLMCTDSGLIRHANRAAERVFKIPPVDLVGRDVAEFLMEPDTVVMRQPDSTLKLLERERFETYAVRGTGEGFPAEITSVPVKTEGYTRFSIYIRDITLRRSYEERLKRLANYDPLTGLANRVLLLDHLDTVLKENMGPEGPYAVILGDIDDFRIVNDTLGHVIGDEALKEASARIHQKGPPGSLVSRFGGDEFVLVVPCHKNRSLPAEVCQSILAAFERPLEVAGHRLHVGISLGVAFAEHDDDTATGLLQMADTAMYAAKDGGRNTHRVFTRSMQEESARRLAIQTRLAGAQERGDISLMFQPLVDAKSERIIGAEALMRWHDAELGQVGPAEFIPVAESTGLIIEFGEWALGEACRHAREWRNVIPNFHVAVNLSPVQLIGTDVASIIKTALLKHTLEPEALEIEITEGLLIQDPHEAEITLNELADIGVSISIDDFGTGYSSLSYLQRFPFTTLKIDRTFVKDLPESVDSRSLVTAVFALAQRSGLKVIAEGVETQGQSAWLKEQGCDIIQGYYYGKPTTVQAFDALVGNREADTNKKGAPNLKLV